jgi:undecaprenyl-diphosphatase
MRRLVLPFLLLLAGATLGAWAAPRPPSAFDLEGRRLAKEAGEIVGEGVLVAISRLFVGPWQYVTVGLVAAGILWRCGPRAALFVLLCSGTAHLLTEFAKERFDRPRPEESASRGGASYPSGHVFQTAALFGAAAVAASRGRGRRVRVVGAAVVAALVVLMAWSRVGLGRHWPTDTIGGALFGFAVVTALAATLSARGGRPSAT